VDVVAPGFVEGCHACQTLAHAGAQLERLVPEPIQAGSNGGGGAELLAEDVHVHFEGVRAVDGVDVTLHRNEILGLIGPNGAGKTTLVNVLSGFQRPTSGSVVLAGQEITGWPPHEIALAGLCRTFQAVRPFPHLSVRENVEVAALAGGAKRWEARAFAEEILAQVSLNDVGDLRADALPHGLERRLGIARALAARPQFLLLDEPGAGLNEAESDDLIGALRVIQLSFSLGLLVIEHDMKVIMNLCDRIQVLDHGKTIALGTPDAVRADPEVITAYLGSGRGEHA